MQKKFAMVFFTMISVLLLLAPVCAHAVETSQFVTAIVIAILVVVFITALTHKRMLKIFLKSR